MGKHLDQFLLLLWKNYTLQRRRKLLCAVEIGLPTAFLLALLVLRQAVVPEHVDLPSHWDAFSVEELPVELLSHSTSATHSPGSASGESRRWRLCYTPNLPVVHRIMSRVASKLDIGIEDLAFPTEEDLVNFLATENETNADVLGAVVFTSAFPNSSPRGESLPSQVSYKIRLRAEQYFGSGERVRMKTASDWMTGYVFPLVASITPREPNETEGGAPGYYREGFLAVQRAVDISILLEQDPAAPWDSISLLLKRHPFPPYVDDPFVKVIQAQLPIVILLSFLVTAPNICKDILLEKERKLKEFMRMMGLRNWQHWLAWLVKYVVFCLISLLIMTLLLFLDFGNGGIFNYSDPTLVVVFLFLYCAATILFCFAIASVFSKATYGASAGAVVFLATYLPYFFLANRYAQFTLTSKVGSCLMHNVAMAFGCYLIGVYEGRGAGLRWSNISQPINVTDDFTMVHVMLMLVVDCVLYGVVTWYVDAVRPGDYGRPQPLYFPFTRSYWFGEAKDQSRGLMREEEMSSVNYGKSSDLFEAAPNGSKAGIAIRNLKKVFKHNGKKKVAVNGLSLDMYEGQITALLGRNGAGKTTTMFMLTGFLMPTDGTAYVNGLDIRRRLDSIRESLGLCPQHDVLFDNMTVEEHLKFFGKLKGVKEEDINREVRDMVRVLRLERKRDKVIQTLSGGMKRRVSVGIALIGGSKVVMLDEPTSGMDPEARRQLWDILQSQRQGRIMILCTHFMDEADYLGDRIAIMADGQARCCGTSLFLKNKYGVGYHMTIVKEPDCDVRKVTQLVQGHVSQAVMESNVGAELSYVLPKESSGSFERLFNRLESNKGQLGISSFGASVTTMEEVFLKVGESFEDQSDEQETAIDCHQDGNCNGGAAAPSIGDNGETIYFEKNTGWHRVVQQYWALTVKQAIHSWRNRMLALLQFIVPLGFVVVGCLIVNSFPGPTDPPPRHLTIKQYKDPVAPYAIEDSENVSDFTKNLSMTYASVMKLNSASVISLNEALPNVTTPNMELYLLDVADSEFIRYVNDYMVAAVFGEQPRDGGPTVAGYFNNEGYHSPGVTLTYISNAIVRYFLGDAVSLNVTNHPLPRQTTARSAEEVATSAMVAMILGHNLSFGLCFLVGSFAVLVIKERANKSKHIQYVSGVHAATYWTSTFTWNLINFMLPALCILAIFIVFDIKPFHEGGQSGYLLLALLFFGCAVLPWIYLFSYVFDVPSTGYVWITVLNIFLATVAMLVVELLENPAIGAEKAGDIIRWVFMLIVPNYALLVAVQSLYNNYESLRVCHALQQEISPISLDDFCTYLNGFNETSVCCKDKCEPECINYHEDYLAWELPGMGKALFCMATQFVVYFVLVLFIDSGVFISGRQLIVKWTTRCRQPEVGGDREDEQDIDVIDESTRIKSTPFSQLMQTDSLILSEMQKYYGDLAAVNRVSVGIPQGECFGLLGVNGAGKTTTFKMLTGDETLSGGDAWLDGYSVKTSIKQAQQKIGYCPQSDALIEQMTVRETLTMYGRLRGIRENFLPEVVETLVSSLRLETYMDSQAGMLSGGNKRKLSTAMALIGEPPILFLDEPTTGMDPVARRLLWDTLTKVRATGRTLILTSHSMEECEALCTRLAIMVNGKFKCLGSTQKLKSKFGDGYTLMAKLSQDQDQKALDFQTQHLRTFIEESFPGSQLKDFHTGCLYYQIESGHKSWADIFGTMERAKVEYNIEDYSVNQTTLDQVFLNFARAQKSLDLTKLKCNGQCKCCCLGSCCGEQDRRSCHASKSRRPHNHDVKI